MTKLILHIGTEKTGTTSIQSFLAINRKRLTDQGFYVPAFLGEYNHARLPLLAYNPDRFDNLIVTAGLNDPAHRAEMLKRWRRRLENAVRTSTADTWIVTSELLQSRLRTSQELQRLRALLAPLFSEIRIIVYLRRPLDTAISLWSTTVKSGQVLDSLPHPSSPYWENVCNHRKTIEQWSAAFGNTIDVRLFEREQFVKSDLILDFCAACGISDDVNFEMPPRENETLSHQALVLLNQINRQIPRIAGGHVNPRRGNLAEHFIAPFAGFQKYQPTSDEVALYDDYFSQSNEWVRQQFFPEKEHLFRIQPPTDQGDHKTNRAPENSKLSELETAFATTVAALWLDRSEP